LERAEKQPKSHPGTQIANQGEAVLLTEDFDLRPQQQVASAPAPPAPPASHPPPDPNSIDALQATLGNQGVQYLFQHRPHELHPHTLLSLQRTIGNQGVQRLLDKPGAMPLQGGTVVQLVRRRGHFEGEVRVRWSDDDAEFFRRLTAATHQRFRGVPEAAMAQPFHSESGSFHYRYSRQHTNVSDGARVSVFVSFHYDGDSISGLQLLSAEDRQQRQADQAYEQQRRQHQSQQARQILESNSHARLIHDMLQHASLTRRTRVDAQYLIGNNELRVLQISIPEPRSEWRVSGQSVTDSVVTFFAAATMNQGGTDQRIISFNYELSGNEWQLQRFDTLAVIQPRNNPPPSGSVGGMQFPEEASIIDEIRGTRRMILTLAGELIMQQHPLKLENLAMNVGPFAIMGVLRAGRTARLGRLTDITSLLRRLRSPSVWRQWQRGSRYHVNTAIDAQLLSRARDFRAQHYLLNADDFANHNIAIARVKIDGNQQYIDLSNLPGRTLGGTGGGIHSEQLLIGHLADLKKQRNVRLEQLYTERHPCAACASLLQTHFREAQVFYSVEEGVRGAERGRLLMRIYGLE
jgi:hypothetical protein